MLWKFQNLIAKQPFIYHINDKSDKLNKKEKSNMSNFENFIIKKILNILKAKSLEDKLR